MDMARAGRRIRCMAKSSSRHRSVRRRIYVLEWRKHRGLTLERLAEMAGYTAGAINQLEKGHVNYTQPMLEALSSALNCEPADLIKGPPSHLDELAAIYASLDAEQRPVALEILKALKPRS